MSEIKYTLLGLLLWVMFKGSLVSASVEGFACQLANGDMGVCTKISDCPAVNCSYVFGAQATCCICSGDDILVCCDQSRSLSERACNRYKKYYAADAERHHEDLKFENVFSYVTALGFMPINSLSTKAEVSWLCGGALISEKYVLSSAHCITDPLKGSLKKARIGIIPSDGKNIFDVDEIITHEDFDPPMITDDIALIRLFETIELSNKFLLPCLSARPKQETTESQVIIGWDSPGANTKSGVQKFTADIQNCKKHSSKVEIPGNMKNSVICVQNKVISSGGKCLANSGGHLLQVIDETPTLIGLASYTFGSDCKNTVYTNVTHYLKWIECIVWGYEGVN